MDLLQESPAATSGGMFGGDDKILDHPMRLNLDEGALKTFLFGKEGGGDLSNKEKICLEKVYCGASGTAMILTDGRCFVVGSNKNGELG